MGAINEIIHAMLIYLNAASLLINLNRELPPRAQQQG